MITPDDKLLLDKAYDAVTLSQRRNIPRFTAFLNEHESLFLKSHLPKSADVLYWGGYPDAVRVMLGAGAQEDSFPVTALEFTYKAEFDLRHRDFLGALMALGIRRDTVGDILTGVGRTVVFVCDEIAPYLLSQVDKIGRVGVKVAYADADDLPVPDDFRELTLTLSSLRLDTFVAGVTHLSREKSARLIKSELVTVNHVTETGVSSLLSQGDTVTIRKYGKFVLKAMLGESRKGKTRIAVKHYQ